MDSAVTLAEARAAGCETFALSFRYGQRHALAVIEADRSDRARTPVAGAASVADHHQVAGLDQALHQPLDGGPGAPEGLDQLALTDHRRTYLLGDYYR